MLVTLMQASLTNSQLSGVKGNRILIFSEVVFNTKVFSICGLSLYGDSGTLGSSILWHFHCPELWKPPLQNRRRKKRGWRSSTNFLKPLAMKWGISLHYISLAKSSHFALIQNKELLRQHLHWATTSWI